MATHKVKCWIDYYNAIERGDKNFDVRRDDRGYRRGDTLVLEKFDSKKHMYVYESANIGSLPVHMERTISYILTGGQFGIEPGYVVLALQ